MLTVHSRRRLAALASGALVFGAMALAAPNVQAAPVFTDAATLLHPYGGGYSTDYEGAADCLFSVSGGTEPDVPVLENGPAATATTSSSTTFTNTSIPADTATGTATATGTGKVTSSGGNLSTMDLSVSANSQVTNAVGTSTECRRYVYAGMVFNFEFTVTQPGFLTLTTQNTGTGAYGETYIERDGPADATESYPYLGTEGYGTKFNSTSKVYLPAGTYLGYFQGRSTNTSKSSYSVSGTTTIHAEFHVAGSQTETVSGKGKKYVTLPGARSCTTHSLVPSVTGKKKRADQIKQVTFFVNDRKVKKVKTPDKGDAVTVPVADDQTTDLVAEVKLFPAKKGKPGKVYQVSASYEACS